MEALLGIITNAIFVGIGIILFILVAPVLFLWIMTAIIVILGVIGGFIAAPFIFLYGAFNKVREKMKESKK